MSTINTSGINANYPIPGKNNSSQGFRDNFAQIKTNLNTAATEITDIQTKAVVKSSLTDTTANNDMANTLISNASTSGFRATSYNLGNALSGTVLVNVNQADVQYGSITSNVTLQFAGWSPTNTESNVVLKLTIANANASISLPSACISSNNNFGTTLLENYANVANIATLTAPANAEILEYTFSSLDCGNTVTIEPVNRPFKATQLVNRSPSPTGFKGDVSGAVCVSPAVTELLVTETYANDEVVTANTSSLYTDMVVSFIGNTFGGITAGNTYYVRNVVSATNFTVADNSALSGNVNLSAATGNMYLNPASYMYICTNSYNSTEFSKEAANTYASGNIIQFTTSANLTSDVLNAPIIFFGNTDSANTNLIANSAYYIKTITGANVTVSQTRINGVAGSTFTLGNKTNANIAAIIYDGSDIWKRTNLSSW